MFKIQVLSMKRTLCLGKLKLILNEFANMAFQSITICMARI